MKKIISVLIGVFVIFSVAGCSRSGGNIKPILTDISFCAQIEGQESKALITVGETGGMIAEVISPENLKGLIFKLQDNSITAEYKGLKYDYSTESSPEAMPVLAVYYALRDAFKNKRTVTAEGDEYYIKGKDYKMFLGGTGLPISLETDNLKVLFKDIKNQP